MRSTVTFSSYLIRIIIIAALFFTLPILLSTSGDLPTKASYIRSAFCFFSLTLLSTWMLLGKEYLKYYIVAFIVQALIGVAHYLLLVDPLYFVSSGEPASKIWHEYSTVFECIEQLISNRRSFGLLYFNSSDWYVTHPEIWRIISWPFTFLGHKWLNYAPLNIFSSLLSSMNLMIVFSKDNSEEVEDLNKKRKILLFVAAYFPLFLLNDTLWRDPFGIALISIGLVLVTLSNSFIIKAFSFVALAALSFFQRASYILVTGLSVAIHEIRSRKGASGFILIPIFVLFLFILLRFFNASQSEEYVGSYVNMMSFLTLPIKVLFGLIGPFPWTQFLNRVEFSYQLSDYLMGTFQLGYLFALIFCRDRFSFKNLDYMTLMGFGIALTGVLTTYMHIGYIAEGVFFTLPWFFKQIGSSYRKYFVLSLLVLVLMNIIILLFGNFGFSSLWR